jgi:1-acyl-sn-glycerol-3-phosphate acyltransferase
MQWLRSLVFTAFMFTWTFTYAVFFVLVSWLFPVATRYRLAAWYAARLLGGLRLICRLDYEVAGLENIPDEPHVVLWKHSSAWETFAQFLIGPPKVLVLKRELIFIPFFGWGLAQLRSIAIDRSAGASAVTQVISQGIARLKEGLSILVYPEGTRVPAGETRKFGVSGALLASRAGCPVVPVTHDAGYYWPRRGLLKKPGTIRVVVGKPIPAAGREAREINAEAQDAIVTTLAQIRRRAAGD